MPVTSGIVGLFKGETISSLIETIGKFLPLIPSTPELPPPDPRPPPLLPGRITLIIGELDNNGTVWAETIKYIQWDARDQRPIYTIIESAGPYDQPHERYADEINLIVEGRGDFWTETIIHTREWDKRDQLPVYRIEGRPGRAWDGFRLKVEQERRQAAEFKLKIEQLKQLPPSN
jgi:hypothetical protein